MLVVQCLSVYYKCVLQIDLRSVLNSYTCWQILGSGVLDEILWKWPVYSAVVTSDNLNLSIQISNCLVLC